MNKIEQAAYEKGLADGKIAVMQALGGWLFNVCMSNTEALRVADKVIHADELEAEQLEQD